MSSIDEVKKTLQDIADAIRFRTATTGKMGRSEMARKIKSIDVPVAQTWAKSLELNGLVGDVILPVSNDIRPYAFYNAGYGATNNFNIVIPEGTTRIYGNAFDGCRAKSISIPSTVTQYGAEAFAHSSITSVNIESSADISNACFDGCYSLSDVVFPYDIKFISYYAFRYCSSITTLALPHKLASVGEEAFSGCTKLNDVKFMSDDGILKIYTRAFKNCSSLTSVWFENKPQIIAANAFEGCTALKTINVPWNEGEVANAPWGAVNAKIKYRNTPSTEVELEYGGGLDGVTSAYAVIYNGDDLREYSEVRIVFDDITNTFGAPASAAGTAMAFDAFTVGGEPRDFFPTASTDVDFNIKMSAVGYLELVITFNDSGFNWTSTSDAGTFEGFCPYMSANSRMCALVYNGMPIKAESVTITATPK